MSREFTFSGVSAGCHCTLRPLRSAGLVQVASALYAPGLVWVASTLKLPVDKFLMATRYAELVQNSKKMLNHLMHLSKK